MEETRDSQTHLDRLRQKITALSSAVASHEWHLNEQPAHRAFQKKYLGFIEQTENLPTNEHELKEKLAAIADSLIVHRSHILDCQIRIAVNPVFKPQTPPAFIPSVIDKPFNMDSDTYDNAKKNLEQDCKQINFYIESYEKAAAHYQKIIGKSLAAVLQDHEKEVDTLAEALKALNTTQTNTAKQTRDPLINLLTSWLQKEGKLNEIDPLKLDDREALAQFRDTLSEYVRTARPKKNFLFFGDNTPRPLTIDYGMFCHDKEKKYLQISPTADEKKTIHDAITPAEDNMLRKSAR